MTNNFLIGPLIKEGMRSEVKPHAIPEDAFESLSNAYQWRGRIVKRSGYKLLARLSTDGGTTFLNLPVMGIKTQDVFKIGVQNTIAFDTQQAYLFDALTEAFSILPSIMPVTWSGTDSQFFWTTNYAGAFWATNSKPGIHGASISGIVTGATTTITTTAPHGFTTGQWVSFIAIKGTTELNGQNAQITVLTPTTFSVAITTTNAYISGGFALNNQVSTAGQDGIRYYGNAAGVGNTWLNYNPPIDTQNALMGALLIFPYRGYLVFLNTTEGNSTTTFQDYPNRARWTQIGTPYYSPPFISPSNYNQQSSDPLAARDDIFGRGGASDAPTDDIIVAAGFIRDILVVYFTKSTWRLRFVNNSQNPFVWERVNVELGSSSTFSTIPFDKGLMAIGTRGIVVSDANDTLRFDDKIPDEIFNIRQTNNGLQRVNGIRTFRTKLLFWTFPNAENPLGIYPDNVLVYNYESQTWSFFDDCFTCFGYGYGSSSGLRWQDLTSDWSSYTDVTWDSGVSQEGYETVLAGNQHGYILQLEQTNGQNDPSLNITSFATTVNSTNHNLKTGDWIKITGTTGVTSNDGVSLNNRNFFVNVNDANSFFIREWKSMTGPNASGTTYNYIIAYEPILPGSVQINVGALQFTDPNSDGILISTGSNTGTIDYNSGAVVLNFNPSIGSTSVNLRVVSYDQSQTLVNVFISGSSAGFITKISNFDIQTKIFNFFKDDKRSRLSKIDFYTDTTQNGQLTCNVFADSSNAPVNTPLADNPQSNVILTSINPYQFGAGSETIYRLFADSVAQTLQLQLIMSDQQMAVDAITKEDFELLSMMFTMRRGGRLP